MRFDSFSHMLQYWASQTPDRPALFFEENGLRELSFSELLALVEERGGQLRAGGGTWLGIFADGSLL